MGEEPKSEPLDYAAPQPSKKRGIAASAMTLGIVATPLMGLCFAGVIPAAVGIVLGSVALWQLRDKPGHPGRVQALVGIIGGGIALLVGGICAAAMRV